MEPRIVHTTKTDAALQILRERIRSGELAPGSRIQANELAVDLSMSLTPVREALRVLSADGLVEFRSHRGAVVADTSATHAEVWELRALLEPRAVQLAVPHLTGDRLDELERLHELCSAIELSTQYIRNRDWHFAIYECAQQEILLSFIRRLWDVFPWRTLWAIRGRPDVSIQEHEAVMEAIRRGDAQAAGKRMLAHILSARKTVESKST